ncbi:MAG: toll/interleukin-1 receptor domain-containing protein, partial [Chloroflexota bacterium]
MNDIFISYSRKDTDFVRRLFTALEEQKYQAWVDWKGIDYSTKWWEEICAGIDRANNFVFVISPDALNSKYCHEEIAHARQFNKRIIPFIYIDLDEEKWRRQPLTDQALNNWEYLKSLQFISYPKLNDFDKAVAALVTTADKDPQHVLAHTELLAAAQAWITAGKSPGSLLRDERLIQTEAWL